MLMPRKPVLDERQTARQVAVDVRGLPVGDHRAQFLHVLVEEALLFRGQRRGRRVEEAAPVGTAREQFAVPPHGPRLDRLALGLRHRRHDLAEGAEYRIADQAATQRRDEQRQRDQRKQHGQDDLHPCWQDVR
jgi:hypothetical protein